MSLKETPPGWPRMSSSVFYQDAAKAIDWLCHAFGFEVRLRIEDDAGRIIHSELEYGDGLVMIGQETIGDGAKSHQRVARSPRSVGNMNTQCIMFFVDDVDAHCAHARASGAQIVDPPETHDYGDDYWVDRTYSALDCEGHLWWVTQRMRTGGRSS